MSYLGFKKLESELATKGVKDPAALSAKIGAKKYGPKRFKMAAKKGRKLKGAGPLRFKKKG